MTAFERAMQDVYGAQWKERLNGAQRNFVRKKENKRPRSWKMLIGGPFVRHARDDEYIAARHEKVKKFRNLFLQRKQAREAEEKAKSKRNSPNRSLEP